MCAKAQSDADKGHETESLEVLLGQVAVCGEAALNG